MYALLTLAFNDVGIAFGRIPLFFAPKVIASVTMPELEMSLSAANDCRKCFRLNENVGTYGLQILDPRVCNCFQGCNGDGWAFQVFVVFKNQIVSDMNDFPIAMVQVFMRELFNGVLFYIQ